MRFGSYLAGLAAVASVGTARAQGTEADDIYQTVFQQVDKAKMQELLKDQTGYNTVRVGVQTFRITDRYLPASKANYRKYWKQYFNNMGIPVKEMTYESSYNIEQEGHDLEAVIPGKSKDSVVIIVHYDSMGPHGSDNPAVDDDMTGMTELMETARILAQYPGQLKYTVRFVAADYEEWGGLEGARYYAEQIRAQAERENFEIVGAIDFEQAGWKEGANTFDVFDCGGRTPSTALGDLLVDTARKYGTLATHKDCMGENSDHYAMWEIGVPAVVFSEHDPFNNPHFDHAGGDTYERINQDYFFAIAQVGVTFATRVVGIEPATVAE